MPDEEFWADVLTRIDLWPDKDEAQELAESLFLGDGPETLLEDDGA